MEAIKIKLSEVITHGTLTVQIPKRSELDTKRLKNSSREINALDCIGGPIAPEDIIRAEELIKVNYGLEEMNEKFSMLWKLIQEEGWTNERLMRTVKWVLKTKKYSNWTIADFFEYEIKLHPYSWYLLQIHKGVRHDEMRAYRVNGRVYWTMDDGTELPLEKA